MPYYTNVTYTASVTVKNTGAGVLRLANPSLELSLPVGSPVGGLTVLQAGTTTLASGASATFTKPLPLFGSAGTWGVRLLTTLGTGAPLASEWFPVVIEQLRLPYSGLLAAMGKSSGQSGFDVRYDVNGDGAISILDFSTLTSRGHLWVDGQLYQPTALYDSFALACTPSRTYRVSELIAGLGGAAVVGAVTSFVAQTGQQLAVFTDPARAILNAGGDFVLEPGRGYQLVLKQIPGTAWFLQGNPDALPAPLLPVKGWNLVGLPASGGLRASQTLTALRLAGVAAMTIALGARAPTEPETYFHFNLAPGTYTNQGQTYRIADFPLLKDRAYWLRIGTAQTIRVPVTDARVVKTGPWQTWGPAEEGFTTVYTQWSEAAPSAALELAFTGQFIRIGGIRKESPFWGGAYRVLIDGQDRGITDTRGAYAYPYGPAFSLASGAHTLKIVPVHVPGPAGMADSHVRQLSFYSIEITDYV